MVLYCKIRKIYFSVKINFLSFQSAKHLTYQTNWSQICGKILLCLWFQGKQKIMISMLWHACILRSQHQVWLSIIHLKRRISSSKERTKRSTSMLQVRNSQEMEWVLVIDFTKFWNVTSEILENILLKIEKNMKVADPKKSDTPILVSKFDLIQIYWFQS